MGKVPWSFTNIWASSGKCIQLSASQGVAPAVTVLACPSSWIGCGDKMLTSYRMSFSHCWTKYGDRVLTKHRTSLSHFWKLGREGHDAMSRENPFPVMAEELTRRYYSYWLHPIDFIISQYPTFKYHHTGDQSSIEEYLGYKCSPAILRLRTPHLHPKLLSAAQS